MAYEEESLTAKEDSKENEGWGIREAAKTRTFVEIALIQSLALFSWYMVTVHAVPFVADMGISEVAAAGALGLILGISCVGRIVVPAFSGRIEWKYLLTVCCGVSALAMLWFMEVRNLWMLYSFTASSSAAGFH